MDKYYEILELKPGASPEEVKQAYRDLVKVWHPDRFSHDPRLIKRAQEKLKEINRAYERLQSYSSRPGKQSSYSEQSTHKTGSRQEKNDSQQSGAQSGPKQPPQAESPVKAESSWRIPIILLVIAAFGVFRLISGQVSSPTKISSTKPQLIPLPPNPAINENIQLPEKKQQNEYIAPSQKSENVSIKAMTAALQKHDDSFPVKQPIPKNNEIYRQAPSVTYFTVGSTKDEVLAIQGTPDSFTNNSFTYGASHVYFENNRVISWQLSYPKLKVQMLHKTSAKNNFFTIGSSKDEVLAIQGTPDSFTDKSFTYGASHVYFENNRVISWQVSYPKLKVQMLHKTSRKNNFFTIGSSKDEVLAIQGTPDSFTDKSFTYGASHVYFENNRVISWQVSYPKLKVQMSPTAKK